MKTFKKFISIKSITTVLFFIYVLYPILGNYLNVGDDTAFHLLRISEIFDNLKNGYILPTIYANSLDGYGYGNPFFYPDLFLYIPALLMFTGISVAVAYKILLIIITIVTMYITYYSVKGIFKSDNVAFLTMIAYTGSMYRIHNIQVRGALGEIIAMTFLPLIIYGLYKVVYDGDSDYKERKLIYLPLSLGFTLTLYTHLISFFIMVLTAGIYFIKHIRKIYKEKRYIDIIKATLVSIGLSSPFLFPMLFMMSKDVYSYNETVTFKLTDRLINILEALEIQINDYLLFFIWIVVVAIIVFLCKYIFKKYKYSQLKRISVEMLLVGIFMLILATDLTPWVVIEKLFPPIGLIQFPFRFLSLALFFIILSNCIILDKLITNINLKILIVYMVTILLSINTLSYYGLKGTNDYIPNTNYIGQGEYLPKGYEYSYYTNKENIITSKDDNLEIISDNKNLRKREIVFKTNVLDDELILPYTYYYGYEVTVNNKKVEVFKTDKALLGVKLNDITEGTLKVEYKQPFIRYLSLGICGLTILVLMNKKKRLI